ncbi:glycosyltransferase family 2 protein [Geminicoccus flavidas]|uniref:glycosyltransferase family 2 protein n=1 Tax=Geminicoccus flavidas TaxID=2506407 RepID=UPI00135C29F7|nr:glycosyltransferase [Geminicoccus flavidas]
MTSDRIGDAASPEAGVSEVGVVMVTHRSRAHLDRSLPPLLASPLRPRVLVVNSSSGDGTVERAEELGAETWVVPRRSFNHGATREAARHRLGTAVVVMITPDAYPASPDELGRLVHPVLTGQAACAYGRQLPHSGADTVEAFGRTFSYPDRSDLHSAADRARLGSGIHFCSNAWAAWSNAALDRIGGFRPTLVSEETIAVARLLREGERIAYVADAVVRHSHRYTPFQEFTRHFDIGWTRAAHAELLLAQGGEDARGRRFATELLLSLLVRAPWQLPTTLVALFAKWSGYRAGLLGRHLPPGVAAALSGQDFFWRSDFAPKGRP